MSANKEHFSKVLAAVLIATCLVLIARTHLTPREEEVSLRDIDFALGLVAKSCRENPAPSYSIPKGASIVDRNMQQPEKPFDDDTLISWKFYPRPNAGSMPHPPAPAATVYAVLPSASLSQGVTGKQAIALTLSPGTGSKHTARFKKNDRLRAKWTGDLGGELVIRDADSSLLLQGLAVETRRIHNGTVRVTVARLKDTATGRTIQLDMGSHWWPKDAARGK